MSEQLTGLDSDQARGRLDAALPTLLSEFDLPARTGWLRLAARGAMGRIWRLSCADGSDYALKELLWGDAGHDVASEARFRDAAVASGVAAPELFQARSGRYTVRLPIGDDGVWVRLFSWVNGAKPENSLQTAQWVGSALARMHALAVPPDSTEVDPWYDTVPDSEVWSHHLSRAQEMTAPWRDRFAAALPVIRELAARVEHADTRRLITCHRDFKRDNVVRRADGDYVLLDWDDFGPALPDHELAWALVRWFVDGPSGAIRKVDLRAAMKAYRQDGGTGLLGEDSFSMLIATSLNYLHGMLGAALEKPDVRQSDPFAVSEVESGLRDLPDPVVLDRIRTLAG